MEELLEEFQAGRASWVDCGLRESRWWVNGVSQLNGEHRFGSCQHWVVSVVGELSRGIVWHVPMLLSPQRIALAPSPPLFPLKLVNLVSSCMSLVLFELLSLNFP